jgi:hypothetical protein
MSTITGADQDGDRGEEDDQWANETVESVSGFLQTAGSSLGVLGLSAGPSRVASQRESTPGMQGRREQSQPNWTVVGPGGRGWR